MWHRRVLPREALRRVRWGDWVLYHDASRFSPIRQGNTCINVVDFDPDEGRFGTWTEVLLNYVAHTEDRGAASGGRS